MYYKRSKGKLLVHKLAEIIQWFQWTYHSEGKNHCEECQKLDGCWFPENKKPQWPHHPFFHCTLDPIDYNVVLMNAAAHSDYSKFDPYLFNTTGKYPHNKEKLKILDLGLEDRMTTKVGLLSGGQRQALTLLMAMLQKPKLLLLDEHTAALDPKTAAKVLDATQKIVEKDHLTMLMITHNMRDAIAYGNRLIMMYNGHIVVDVSGEEKKNLTVEQLLNLFSQASGSDEVDDKLVLS